MAEANNDRRRMREDPTVSNAQKLALWPIDVNQDASAVPLDELNPGHPDLFEADKMWPYFERLRREDPVHYTADSQFGPYWSVTKFDDIMYVDSHHQLFSSDSRYGGIALTLGGWPPTEAEQPDPAYAMPMFIMSDPPKHDAQRAAVAPMFAPTQIAGMETLIRERAGKILDGLPLNEDFNWVPHVSIELTSQMLATLFGIPQEDRLKLIDWSEAVSNLGNPEHFDSVEEGFKVLQECAAYFMPIFEQRKTQPRTADLISMLAHNGATRDMPPNEFLGNVLLLIVGGNDTTRNSISGGVLALNRNPAEYDKLRQNPSLIPKMVPEIIRWQSPVAHMARTALVDTQIGGKNIKAGERVAMWYISGNRDEDKIPHANQFIIDRPNARHHVSFGFGIHRCVGNRLAEMQLRVIWEELMKRFPKIDVVGDPKYVKSCAVHGISELPVRIRA
jgi:cytochrome P450